MNNQLIIEKINDFYTKYDDYIKYNFILFILIISQYFIFYLVPSLILTFFFMSFAFPILIFSLYNKTSVSFLKVKLFVMFIVILYHIGWGLQYNIFKIQFLIDIYYYFFTILFLFSVLIIDIHIKIRTILFNLLVAIILRLIVFLLAFNNFENNIILRISFTHLLDILQYIQILNILIFSKAQMNYGSTNKNKIVLNYFNKFNMNVYLSEFLKIITLVCFLCIFIFQQYYEGIIDNKAKIDKFNHFVSSGIPLDTKIKLYKIYGKKFKLYYYNDSVDFYINNVYKCNTYNYPDFLIDFKDVETLQISKSKDSDRFSFSLNGQCVEASVSLSN